MTLCLAFRSGMSSKSDLRGAMDAGVPVGVVAGHLTTAQIVMALPRYLDSGSKVFIDSGAFTAERTGETMDWARVLSVYESVAGLTDRPEMLYVVAPDKVGCQGETLNLLRRYRKQLQQLLAQGVQLIVPLQYGNLPAATMLASAQEILETDRFVAGIPANKAAMPIEECRSLQHHTFHILGRVQADGEQVERIETLRAGNPGVFVSGDANWLRSHLGVVAMLTDTERLAPSSPRRVFGEHPRVCAIRNEIERDLSWGFEDRRVAV